MRVRFAPSPTGHLHVGNARTALFNWLLARHAGGTFVLRIEDTDIERSTEASERAIVDDLRWLGLTWDEGPDIGGPYGPYRQSERLALYDEHAKRLLDQGDAYYCFCSEEQIERDRREALAAGRPPRYSGRCRAIPPAEAESRIAAGARAAMRFRIPHTLTGVSFHDLVRGEVRFPIDVLGDPVIVRSDGRPAYNFAVVVDDAAMKITDVIRGEDHVSNTPRQILLYRALGLEPPRFAHLSLVLGPDHTPLSKRHGATSVNEFRARGYLPEALVNYLALLGWSPGDEELLPVSELAARFSIEAVGKSASVFDFDKLAWVNRHYLKGAEPARIGGLLLPFLRAERWITAETEAARAYVESIVPLVAGSVDRLEDAPRRLQFLFAFDVAAALARADVREVVESAGAIDVIAALASELREAGPMVDRDAFRAVAAAVRQRTGQKGKGLFHPIRVALTGEPAGPELDIAVPAIDRGASLPGDSGVAPIVACRERAARFADALRG